VTGIFVIYDKLGSSGSISHLSPSAMSLSHGKSISCSSGSTPTIVTPIPSGSSTPLVATDRPTIPLRKSYHGRSLSSAGTPISSGYSTPIEISGRAQLPGVPVRYSHAFLTPITTTPMLSDPPELPQLSSPEASMSVDSLSDSRSENDGDSSSDYDILDPVDPSGGCTGVLVKWQPGSVWDTYPYQQHEVQKLPWEPIGFENKEWLRLRSIKCAIYLNSCSETEQNTHVCTA